MDGRLGRLLPPAGALLLFLALYLPTVSPYVGRGDVAKFQLVGPALGTAHPTGYPLYTLLGHAAARLAPSLSWPAATNALSALLVALAAGAVGLGAIALGYRPAAALAATLAFGAAPAVRGAAAVAEVYPLHMLLVAIALAALLAHARTGSGAALALATLVVGVAFAHHATAVCLVPAALAAGIGSPLPGTRRAQAGVLLGALLLATVPYVYLVERSYSSDAPYLEARAHDLDQLVDVATGGPFKGHLGRLGPAEMVTERVPWIASRALAGGWWLLPAGALGLAFLSGARRRIVAWFLVASAIFLTLYDVPDLEAYLLAPFVALAFATAAAADRWTALLERHVGAWVASALLPVVALAPLLAGAPIEPTEVARERELELLAALAEAPRGSALVVVGHEEGLAVELLRHQPPGATGVGVVILSGETFDSRFLLGPLHRHLTGVAPLRLPPEDRPLAPGAPLFLLASTPAERARLESSGLPTSEVAGERLFRFEAPRGPPPPLAFVAARLEEAGPVDVALRRLLAPGFDPSRTLLVPGVDSREGGGGEVTPLEVSPDRMRFAATVATGGGWFVVQETLRARWSARVDGEDAASFQADWGYPALRLGAGEHEVEIARDERPFDLARWLASPWGYLVP